MSTQVEIPIWPGSGSFTSGSSTPFGYYDGDSEFQTDAPKIAKWCAQRLGYPIMDIELQDIQFFTAFEEAVTTYASIVNDFNIRDNMLNVQGSPTGSDITQKNIKSSLHKIIEISDQYGTEAKTGGDVTYKTGSIDLIANQQVYDLDTLWADASESGNRIEVRKIYHYRNAAINRGYDPYVGNLTVMDEFGWNNYSAGATHLLRPLYDEILKVQAIEFNDQIRKSAYSFELLNNQLRIFPIPKASQKLYFDYILKDDKESVLNDKDGTVSDHSNVPYSNIQYSRINDVGKQWIKRYTLALSKEILGEVRSKFASVPGANGVDITLNGDRLISSAEAQQEQLITELKETLEQLSKKAQLERKDQESDFLQNQLFKIPNKIYIG